MKQLIRDIALTALLAAVAGCSTDAWTPPDPVGTETARTPPSLLAAPTPALDCCFPVDESGVRRGSVFDENFESGSAALNEAGVTRLAELAGVLVQAMTTGEFAGPICVEGFADGVGEAAFNQTLSEQRASAIVSALGFAGVTNPMTPRGFGESRAIDGVDDPSQRRVDITLAACG